MTDMNDSDVNAGLLICIQTKSTSNIQLFMSVIAAKAGKTSY